MILKSKKSLLFVSLFILCVGAYLMPLFLCPGAFEKESKAYVLIMRCINFGILVAIILKFARKPLMDALHGVREKIKESLDAIKNQFNDAKSGMDAEQAKLDNIEQYVEEVRERIVEMGKKERDKIVEQAKVEAEKMIADAEAHAKYQMVKAKKELSDEMVDIAISMVEERLKKEITLKDNEDLVDQFLVSLETAKPHLN